MVGEQVKDLARDLEDRILGAAALETSSSLQFTLLGVGFDVAISDSAAIRYIKAFVGQYRDRDRPAIPVSAKVVIDTRRGQLPTIEPSAPRVLVHHHKREASWRFHGRVVEKGRSGRTVVWPSKGIAVHLRKGGTEIEIIVDPGVDGIMAGEAIFHVCRSLALYLRSPQTGVLLHASCITKEGRGVLFAGPPFSGKTTLFLEAVLNQGWTPVSNDRAFITKQSPAIAISWPGYFTVTEGTILAYPQLAEHAIRYEQEDYILRTITWNRPLRRIFSLNAKRMYPMEWLCQIIRRPYALSAPVAILVLPMIRKTAQRVRIESIDAGLEQRLDGMTFAGSDSSFRPWHGLRGPDDTRAAANLVNTLNESGVRVVAVQLPPRAIHDFPHILEALA